MRKRMKIYHKITGKLIFEGADFEGANLEDANLKGACLEDADLRYANLSYANLRYANLRCADFEGANLEGANLRWADLESARNILQWQSPAGIKRICYSVKHDTFIMHQLGCFWGNTDKAVEAIKEKYGENSCYEQLLLLNAKALKDQGDE